MRHAFFTWVLMLHFSKAHSIRILEKDWKINPKYCGSTSTNPEARILNGEEIGKREMPWIVQLQIETSLDVRYFCAGSVITARVILTAAHCLSTESSDIESVQKIAIYIKSRRLHRGPVLWGEKYIINPLFDRRRLINDLALIQVKNRINFHKWVLPVCLPTELRTYEDEYLTIGGWGKTSAGGKPSKYLMREEIALWSHERCEKFLQRTTRYGTNLSLVICGRPSTGGACKGDSGGPLTSSKNKQHAELVGIISSGYGCGTPHLPTIFVRVSQYVKWITQELRMQFTWDRLPNPDNASDWCL